jgi:type IV secretion system protein VirD4
MSIPLGYWDQTFKEVLSYPGDAHGLLCAPSRAGKFRDMLCQVLLSFAGSVFCIDVKGQAAAVTARYRKDVLGQDVYILNPFNILPDYLGKFVHASYDPVASQLDPASDTFAADADNLYEGLIPLGGPEVHWVHSSRGLGSGISMSLREYGGKASLPDAFAQMSDRNLHKFCEDAVDGGLSEHVVSRLSRFAGDQTVDNREIRSIISTAITAMSFVANKPIAENMRESTIDFREMRRKPMTIYVIPPGRYLKTASSWTRTITNSWVDACLQDGTGDVPILGILDEFKVSVGNLEGISTLNAMGAGYGVQLLTVIQDLNQLKELMPQGWQTFLANAGFQIYYAPGPGDLFTADHISRMTGSVEAPTVSRSVSDAAGNPFQFASGPVDAINRSLRGAAGQNSGVQVSMGQRTKRYMEIEDVTNLSDREMLVFGRGLKGVMKAARRPYFQDPSYAGKFDSDPYHRSGSRR